MGMKKKIMMRRMNMKRMMIDDDDVWHTPDRVSTKPPGLCEMGDCDEVELEEYEPYEDDEMEQYD